MPSVRGPNPQFSACFLQVVLSLGMLSVRGPNSHLSACFLQVVLSLLVNRYEFSLVNANAGEHNAWMIPTIPKHGTHITTKRRAGR